MRLKHKLGMGVMSAALGLSLIGGGTVAYFSDTQAATSTFQAGTLDLAVDPSVIVNLGDLKPGDAVMKDFVLKNTGSLPISSVGIKTSYGVTDAKRGGVENTDDFGKHIRVDFLWNEDKKTDVVYSTTLSELKGMSPDAVERDVWGRIFRGEKDGLKPGTQDHLYVMFTFVDNNGDQNQFQGDALELTWEFQAKQTDGTLRQ